MIAEYIVGSGSVDKHDLLLSSFNGGTIKAKEVFGYGLDGLIEEFNSVLVVQEGI